MRARDPGTRPEPATAVTWMELVRGKELHVHRKEPSSSVTVDRPALVTTTARADGVRRSRPPAENSVSIARSRSESIGCRRPDMRRFVLHRTRCAHRGISTEKAMRATKAATGKKGKRGIQTETEGTKTTRRAEIGRARRSIADEARSWVKDRTPRTQDGAGYSLPLGRVSCQPDPKGAPHVGAGPGPPARAQRRDHRQCACYAESNRSRVRRTC